jgi:hypothetical protein
MKTFYEWLELNEVAGRYVFSWHCTNPAVGLEDFSGEDLDDYRDIVDYIKRHAEEMDADDFANMVGGPEVIQRDFLGSKSEENIDEWWNFVKKDWSMGFYSSRYPDGTPIIYHNSSGVEHVYTPYKR